MSEKYWAPLSLGILLALCRPANAENELGVFDARSVGRAGTGTVSDDSGSALLSNPAGLIRRTTPRLQLTLHVGDYDSSFRTEAEEFAPTITNQAPGTHTLNIAYQHGNDAGTWVLGVVLRHGGRSVALPVPLDNPEGGAISFPHRYGGSDWQQSFALGSFGGAIRIGESWGLGASVSLQQVSLRERRHLSTRPPLTNLASDIEMDWSVQDNSNWGAAVGVLFAPPDLPLEFAFSLATRRGLRFSGHAQTRTLSSDPALDLNAQLRLPANLTTRGGMRYLGERVMIEIGGDVYYQRRNTPSVWSLPPIPEYPALQLPIAALTQRSSYRAIRSAIDYEMLSGALWVTIGYAYTSPSVSQSNQSPAFSGLGGHTIAIGLESLGEYYSASIGYARTLQSQRKFPNQADSQDRYSNSTDQVGVSFEFTW